MPPPSFSTEVADLVEATLTAPVYTTASKLITTNFLIDQIVVLVDPNNILNDYTFGIDEAIKGYSVSPNFRDALEPWKSQLKSLCYSVINTIVLPYYNSGDTPGGTTQYAATISQVGTNDPTQTINDNTLATSTTDPPVLPQWSRTTNGDFQLTAPSSFGASGLRLRYTLSWNNPPSNLRDYAFTYVNASTVRLRTYAGTVDTDGVITWTLTDDMLTGASISITVFPAP